jgi:hypothetical protein
MVQELLQALIPLIQEDVYAGKQFLSPQKLVNSHNGVEGGRKQFFMLDSFYGSVC